VAIGTFFIHWYMMFVFQRAHIPVRVRPDRIERQRPGWGIRQVTGAPRHPATVSEIIFTEAEAVCVRLV
jgi:hypothetical protein